HGCAAPPNVPSAAFRTSPTPRPAAPPTATAAAACAPGTPLTAPTGGTVVTGWPLACTGTHALTASGKPPWAHALGGHAGHRLHALPPPVHDPLLGTPRPAPPPGHRPPRTGPLRRR